MEGKGSKMKKSYEETIDYLEKGIWVIIEFKKKAGLNSFKPYGYVQKHVYDLFGDLGPTENDTIRRALLEKIFDRFSFYEGLTIIGDNQFDKAIYWK